jgi:hypothetical protein
LEFDGQNTLGEEIREVHAGYLNPYAFEANWDELWNKGYVHDYDLLQASILGCFVP